ncbi:hypothetical protein ACRALDRAFT_209751 [Sodiomyces alcalophilus JCM 7366]|uniref:uncharacterized protein n=1 Tax=Sodiomyces alcalophilus JCM 7366 TaxID=591952 RepID=UPI0039B4F267
MDWIRVLLFAGKRRATTRGSTAYTSWVDETYAEPNPQGALSRDGASSKEGCAKSRPRDDEDTEKLNGQGSWNGDGFKKYGKRKKKRTRETLKYMKKWPSRRVIRFGWLTREDFLFSANRRNNKIVAWLIGSSQHGMGGHHATTGQRPNESPPFSCRLPDKGFPLGPMMNLTVHRHGLSCRVPIVQAPPTTRAPEPGMARWREMSRTAHFTASLIGHPGRSRYNVVIGQDIEGLSFGDNRVAQAGSWDQAFPWRSGGAGILAKWYAVWRSIDKKSKMDLTSRETILSLVVAEESFFWDRTVVKSRKSSGFLTENPKTNETVGILACSKMHGYYHYSKAAAGRTVERYECVANAPTSISAPSCMR